MSDDKLPVKQSEYKIYKDLKFQEMMNPKDKFDNRLYFSWRYKNHIYFTNKTDEIFKEKENRDTFWKIIVSLGSNFL